MTNPVPRGFVATAFRELVERGTKHPCYEAGKTPPEAPYPFTVVTVVSGGGEWAPSLADDYSTCEVVLQVTSSGVRGDQAELLADRVRLTVLARGTSGYQVPMEDPEDVRVVRRESRGYDGCEPVGNEPRVVHNAVETFALLIERA